LLRTVKELQKEKYNVTQVFVTFETEEGQRNALSGMASGKLDIMRNNVDNAPPSAIFQGSLLKVKRPTEPSAVRYLDLSASKWLKMGTRLLTLGITAAFIGLAGFVVARARYSSYSEYLSAALVSMFNVVVPLVVKQMMNLEQHPTEGGFQASLYFKITLFRWFNTAILPKWLTNFTSTVSSDKQSALSQINAILWSEMWITPAVRLLDLGGNFEKHILAPRARNQELMNRHFQGTFYHLGERYTDLAKVLFVVLYYSALFPGK
jgi:hypothetical protein